jgi:hypothetical protein
MQLMLLQQH